jgi:two-component system osmolarity sensor histidine kinase EnvZ
MTALDTGMAALRSAATTVRSAAGRVGDLFDRFSNSIRYVMPKGLYARALLIIIVPMVVLQSVIAFVFMERHWNSVTQRLSAAVVQDIAGLIDVYTTLKADQAQIRRIAQERFGLVVDFLPVAEMPPVGPKKSASASGGRSGSTPSAAPRWSRSASGSTTR